MILRRMMARRRFTVSLEDMILRMLNSDIIILI